MLGLGTSISALHDGITGVYNTTTNTKSLEFTGYSSGTNNPDTLTVDDDDLLSFTAGTNGDGVDLPFSAAFWIKRGESSGHGIFTKNLASGATSNLEYRLFYSGATLFMDISDGGKQNADIKRTRWTNNSTNWQHIVVTYTGVVSSAENMKCYVNGTKLSALGGDQSTDDDGMENQDGKLHLGNLLSDANFDFKGHLAQFIMWRNHELSQSEVNYLYAGGATHRDPTKGAQDYDGSSKIVLWLPLDADLNDDGPNGFNGTAVNSTALDSTVPF